MGNIWQQLWLCAATARSVHAELKPEQSHGPASPFHSHWDRARRSSGTRMASAVVRASVWVSPSAPAHIFCVTAVCSAKSRNSSTSAAQKHFGFQLADPGEPPTPRKRACGGLPCPPECSTIHWGVTERLALCWALEASSHNSFLVSLHLQHTHHCCSWLEQS